VATVLVLPRVVPGDIGGGHDLFQSVEDALVSVEDALDGRPGGVRLFPRRDQESQAAVAVLWLPGLDAHLVVHGVRDRFGQSLPECVATVCQPSADRHFLGGVGRSDVEYECGVLAVGRRVDQIGREAEAEAVEGGQNSADVVEVSMATYIVADGVWMAK
jgi:hypothetical protein